MISYTGARKLLIAQARSFGKERIGLAEAYGRVLSETILADRDYPPFNRSSVDGYAIRHHDLEQDIRHFAIVETIYAGFAGTTLIRSGECYKIMTGAPVPAGADAVIRREDTEEGEDAIVVGIDACRPFIHISRKGEDMRSGDTVIDRPSLCEPALVGLLASLGKSELTVARLPRIAILTTGNEVVPVESPVSAVQIRNSNRWLMQSFLKKWEISPGAGNCVHVPDDRALLRSAVERVVLGSPGQSPADLVLLSGGVSAGDADYVPGVLEELGVSPLFHKLAIKPGKPAWCGVSPAGGMVFALPGNPFSCLVGLVLLVQPWLYASFGLPVPEPLGLPLHKARKKRTPLDEFFPVRMDGSPAGLEPVVLNGSGDIRLGPGANALALHPAECNELAEGAITSCYPF
jgi:molybdopterin molybdotransferase